MKATLPGDWLAVLANDREAVLAIIEVVWADDKNVEGFMLFPDEGTPVWVPIGRCIEFVKGTV